jgi:hypothetical protein
MSDDILVRIANRIHDSHMQIEHLLDECAEEIKKLRLLLEKREEADWERRLG